MSDFNSWYISGSYFEVCNCEAICPCRIHRSLRRASYDTCDFALSWHITDGRANTLDLSGLSVVLAGTYNRDEPELPGSHWPPWRVVLYLDERGEPEQQEALTDIFLGRVGGGTLHKFAHAIGEVYAVRPARIDLDHTQNQERIKIGQFVEAYTAEPVITDEPVFCTIPGADRPGQEIVAEHFQMDDEPLRWQVSGRCGFAKDFIYSSED